ncbi:hypothetical protein HYV64_02965 [Candidatus Shapirobacteria bacterium]|nr:hypothetical protein [Candidatus Shapirobacteria bacterium]
MKNKIDPDLKNIVLAKIMAYDDDYELVIGGEAPLNKEDLVINVKNETEIGKKIVTIQSDFMRDLVNGEIYKILETV